MQTQKDCFCQYKHVFTHSGFWDIILKKSICNIGTGNFKKLHMFFFGRLESCLIVGFTVLINLNQFFCAFLIFPI